MTPPAHLAGAFSSSDNDARELVHLIDAEQVGTLLGMSPRWVLAEARAGRLPCYRLGRRVRFDEAEIAAWLAGQHRPASASPGTRPDGQSAWIAGSRGGSGRRVPTATPPAALYPARGAR